MKLIQGNRTELHYLDQGGGQSVLLVHGSLSDYRTWSGQVGALARRFRVISYSRCCHAPNRRPRTGENYSLQVHSDDLVALICQLELAPVHLVGYSSGGLIAAVVAHDRPELVRSLILVDPGIYSLLPVTPERETVLRENAEVAQLARKMMSRGDGEGAARLLLNFVLHPRSADELRPEVRRMFLENGPSFRAQLNSVVAPPALSCADLRQMKMPVLLVGGEKSRPEFRLILDELERCLQNCTRVMVSGAGHGLLFEAPERFNEIVLTFLAQYRQ